ncbi:MAG: hypothetical protein KDC33_07730 [Thermoleophilia bacterium]|nr:hypothetical protein [Thermoleophilia bacterium]
MRDPFQHTLTKDGRVLIHRGGRRVMELGGARAADLRARLDLCADEDARQQVLARVTGNYRRGNERRGRRA